MGGEPDLLAEAERIAELASEEGCELLVHEKSRLRILPLRYLVVLKLYAGGLKSKADILEVLSRNPEEDLDEIETLCQQHRLPGFQEIRRELKR